MLSQIVLTRLAEREQAPHKVGSFSVTRISPCPYATYLNFHGLDRGLERSIEELLLMEDGHWQETQVLTQMRMAGLKMRCTGDQQMVVHVGESAVPGMPDGLVTIGEKEDGLEIKALNQYRYSQMKAKGIESSIRCQVQLYMGSKEWREIGVERTWVFVKHKDSCKLWDFEERFDPGYVERILESTDRVVLQGWEPPKKKNDQCGMCGHRRFCWEAEILDMEGMVSRDDLGEYVKAWKDGKVYEDLGKTMVEGAREAFIRAMGKDDTLLAEDLKVQKVVGHRVQIPVEKYIRVHGETQLSEVLEDKTYSQVKISVM